MARYPNQVDMATVEITSLLGSSSLLHRDQTRDTRTERPQFTLPSETRPVFEVPANDSSRPDFTAISPRLLRELALQRYIGGDIDQNTYIALAQELPMEISDTSGRVIDLSRVTDDTEFNFSAYYADQRQLAMVLGDDDKVQTLTSVLNFIRG